MQISAFEPLLDVFLYKKKWLCRAKHNMTTKYKNLHVLITAIFFYIEKHLKVAQMLKFAYFKRVTI
jgi:hypothetical protein